MQNKSKKENIFWFKRWTFSIPTTIYLEYLSISNRNLVPGGKNPEEKICGSDFKKKQKYLKNGIRLFLMEPGQVNWPVFLTYSFFSLNRKTFMQ